MFILLIFNAFLNISARLLHFFQFYKVIFNETPFQAFVDFYFFTQNNGIFSMSKKCIYFHKVNATPSGIFSTLARIIQNKALGIINPLIQTNEAFVSHNLSSSDPMGIKCYRELCDLNKTKGGHLLLVSSQGECVLKSKWSNLHLFSNNTPLALKSCLVPKTCEIKTQISQDPYLGSNYRVVSHEANAFFVEHSIELNAFVITHLLLIGKWVVIDDKLYVVDPSGPVALPPVINDFWVNIKKPIISDNLDSVLKHTPDKYTAKHQTINDRIKLKSSIIKDDDVLPEND